MVHYHCCAVDCNADTRKLKLPDKYPWMAEVTFHSFPHAVRRKAMRDVWIRMTRRENFQPNKFTRICSRHFIGGKGPTTEHPVPTLFAYNNYEDTEPSWDFHSHSCPPEQYNGKVIVENEIESYLILLDVTVEEETAIKELFKQRRWLYRRLKMYRRHKFKKTDGKEAENVLVGHRNSTDSTARSILDSSHNVSMESCKELPSYSFDSPYYHPNIPKNACYMSQSSLILEVQEQSDNSNNESNFTNSREIFSQRQSEDAFVDNECHSATYKQSAVDCCQSNNCHETKFDDSFSYDREKSNTCSQWLQVGATELSSLGSQLQDSFNYDRTADNNRENNHGLLSFYVQMKEEDNICIDSTQAQADVLIDRGLGTALNSLELLQTNTSITPVSLQTNNSVTPVSLQTSMSITPVSLQANTSIAPVSLQANTSITPVSLQTSMSITPVSLQANISVTPVSLQANTSVTPVTPVSLLLYPAPIQLNQNVDTVVRNSTSCIYNEKDKFLAFSKGKNLVSDFRQHNDDRNNLANQSGVEIFKGKSKRAAKIKELKVGRNKGAARIMEPVSESSKSNGNKVCESLILAKSGCDEHLSEISEAKTLVGWKQNITGLICDLKTYGSVGNRNCERIIKEQSSGWKESSPETSPESNLSSLDQNITDQNSKYVQTLTEAHSSSSDEKQSKVEKGLIYCEECKKTYTKLKFKSHKINGKCVFECEFCGKIFSSKWYATYLAHRRYHVDDRPYKCEVCHKAYRSRSQLKVHFRNHTGERPWVCEICGAQFMQLGSLTQHKLCKHSNEAHICDICGAKLCKKGNLDWHKKVTHSEERPFPCPACGKMFKSKHQVKIHEVVHKDTLDFVCDVCNKGFKTQTCLNMHVRRHQNDRRYHCETCGKRFYCKKSLRDHQMIHSGEKPFKCTVCDHRCTIKSNLRKHMKVHLSK